MVNEQNYNLPPSPQTNKALMKSNINLQPPLEIFTPLLCLPRCSAFWVFSQSVTDMRGHVFSGWFGVLAESSKQRQLRSRGWKICLSEGFKAAEKQKLTQFHSTKMIFGGFFKERVMKQTQTCPRPNFKNKIQLQTSKLFL